MFRRHIYIYFLETEWISLTTVCLAMSQTTPAACFDSDLILSVITLDFFNDVQILNQLPFLGTNNSKSNLLGRSSKLKRQINGFR